MKRLITTAISGSVGMPLKSGLLDHIQSAYFEAIAEVGKCLIGFTYDTTKVYILSGLVNSGTFPNYNITSGAVFFNGEVYLVPAASFTITNPNVAVGVITTSYFAGVNADPVQFTDGNPRNVCEIRRIIIQPGLSGSGSANFSDFIDPTRKLSGDLGEVKIWDWRVLGGSLSTYFNTITGVGVHPYTLGWEICDGQGSRPNFSGRTLRGFASAQSDYDSPYIDTGGSDNVTLITANLPSHTHSGFSQLRTSSHASSSISNPGNPAGVLVNNVEPFGSIPLDGTDTGSTGSNQAFSVRNSYITVLYIRRYQ